MKEIELTFISHCDDNCGLGSVQFTCPTCELTSTDYDELWWNFMEGKVEAKTTCEHCHTTMTIIEERKGLDFKHYLKDDGQSQL